MTEKVVTDYLKLLCDACGKKVHPHGHWYTTGMLGVSVVCCPSCFYAGHTERLLKQKIMEEENGRVIKTQNA